MCGKKKKHVIWLCVGDGFITNNPFQLLYLDEVLNPTKGYMGKNGLYLCMTLMMYALTKT
jgi:hypothetical protein